MVYVSYTYIIHCVPLSGIDTISSRAFHKRHIYYMVVAHLEVGIGSDGFDWSSRPDLFESADVTLSGRLVVLLVFLHESAQGF